MRGLVAVTLILALAGCTSGPNPHVGIGIGSNGASVYPSVSGTVGGVGGGGIFVPLLNLVLGFDTKSAAALSKCKPKPTLPIS